MQLCSAKTTKLEVSQYCRSIFRQRSALLSSTVACALMLSGTVVALLSDVELGLACRPRDMLVLRGGGNDGKPRQKIPMV